MTPNPFRAIGCGPGHYGSDEACGKNAKNSEKCFCVNKGGDRRQFNVGPQRLLVPWPNLGSV